MEEVVKTGEAPGPSIDGKPRKLTPLGTAAPVPSPQTAVNGTPLHDFFATIQEKNLSERGVRIGVCSGCETEDAILEKDDFLCVNCRGL